MNSALIIGLGGLGCPVVELLVASGVTRLTLADFDRVEASNLPRQWLYRDTDIGKLKTDAARAALLGANPGLTIETVGEVAVAALPALLDAHALACECTDQVDLKFAVNDAAVAAGTPLVVGGAAELRGFAMAVQPGSSPCLRCVFEGPTDSLRLTCRDAGVLAPLPAQVGAVMASLARRLLAGHDAGGVWSLDARRGAARVSTWARRADCAACGARP